MAVAAALENLPVEARGIASGFLQEGHAGGYLLAAVINLFLVPKVSAGWCALFWTASGISPFAAGIRALLPESEFLLREKAAEVERGHTTTQKTKIFLKETKEMLKKHWLLCIYAVLLMTGKFLLYFAIPYLSDIAVFPLGYIQKSPDFCFLTDIKDCCNHFHYRFQLPIPRIASKLFFPVLQ